MGMVLRPHEAMEWRWEPYEVKLGETKDLASPFPANFVAEVTGTSLDVLGAGNVLPNANKAYYRVLAVDEKGKSSGDSDYVEAPRPFIYSEPLTSAPAGTQPGRRSRRDPVSSSRARERSPSDRPGIRSPP